MEIRQVRKNKRRYLPLLLLADEQEDMIEDYLDRGEMFVLDDSGIKAQCVLTDEGGGVLELKSLSVEPACQHQGYGRTLVEFVIQRYRGRFQILQVGTGDSPLTIPFYERLGFVRSHVVKNFFTDHYRHPIYEEGVRLTDMIYLRRGL